MIIRLLRGRFGLNPGTEITVDSKTGELEIATGAAELVDAGNISEVSVEITRPANTTAYTAGDAIGTATVAVKQKETVTLAGVFGTATVTCAGVSAVATFATSTTVTASNFVTANSAAYLAVGVVLTSSGAALIFEASVAGVPFTAPTITNVTSDLSGVVAHSVANVAGVKQKETITLLGAYGTCNITGAGGLTKTVTFDTDLSTTASNFETDYAADYLEKGIVVTASTTTIVFEAETEGVPFTAPTIDGIAGNLAGTVAHTTANVAAVAEVDTVTFTGTSGIAHVTAVGGLTKDIAFVSTLKAMCDQFVLDHATAYDAVGITVTAGATNTLVFTAKTAGTDIVTPVIVGATGNLAGTAAVTTANVVAVVQVETITVTGTGGYATVAAAGGLTKYLHFSGSISDSIATFVTDNAEDYLAEDIILTANGTKIVFTSNIAGTAFTAPTITNIAGVRGTVAHTTANVIPIAQIETITASGTTGQATIAAAGGLTKVLTFTTNWASTWSGFISTNKALYEAQGIVLTSADNVLTFTAAVPGTGFTAPTITVQDNLTGSVAHTTANVSTSPILFSGLVWKGVGSVLGRVSAITNMTALNGVTLRLWFFNSIPSSTTADNSAFTMAYADKDKLLFSVDLIMNVTSTGSDSLSASRAPYYPIEPTSDSLYCVVQTLSAFTPTSGGKLTLTLNSIIA